MELKKPIKSDKSEKPAKPDKFILGLTGGVGAGKSRILKLLEEEYGFHVIQADQVAKKLMEPGMESFQAVVEYLGAAILQGDGTINRPLMADIIFNDPVKKAGIDHITHPLVWKACLAEAAAAKGPLVVMEAAIPSKEFRDNCREMWYVYTSGENRVKRLKDHRNYTEEKSLKIMENQASEEEFRAFSDAVIDNNGSVEETRAQIERQIKKSPIHSRITGL